MLLHSHSSMLLSFPMMHCRNFRMHFRVQFGTKSTTTFHRRQKNIPYYLSVTFLQQLFPFCRPWFQFRNDSVVHVMWQVVCASVLVWNMSLFLSLLLPLSILWICRDSLPVTIATSQPITRFWLSVVVHWIHNQTVPSSNPVAGTWVTA